MSRILARKVINFDHHGDRHVVCAWDECEKDGVELHKVGVQYGTPENSQYVQYVFCSDRHKLYWINSHRSYGNLPPGYRRSTL